MGAVKRALSRVGLTQVAPPVKQARKTSATCSSATRCRKRIASTNQPTNLLIEDTICDPFPARSLSETKTIRFLSRDGNCHFLGPDARRRDGRLAISRVLKLSVLLDVKSHLLSSSSSSSGNLITCAGCRNDTVARTAVCIQNHRVSSQAGWKGVMGWGRFLSPKGHYYLSFENKLPQHTLLPPRPVRKTPPGPYV